MVYHQLLVCREGNFEVQVKVAPWWPTLHGFHLWPCYVHPVAVPLRELHCSTATSFILACHEHERKQIG